MWMMKQESDTNYYYYNQFDSNGALVNGTECYAAVACGPHSNRKNKILCTFFKERLSIANSPSPVGQ